MSELLKQEVSLTVLKIRLETPNSTSDVAVETSSQPAPSGPRVLCELEVTGNAEDRSLAPATTPLTPESASRRKRGTGRPTHEECEDSAVAPTRIVAQWSFAAEEMQIPIEFTDVQQLRDKPGLAGALIANLTRAAVMTIFPEFKADAFERLAAITSWIPSGKPTLPSTMTRQLATLLPPLLHESDCLWLELAEPVGYLPLLPWEELLRPVTSAPILRLSPHSVKASSSQGELSVALCLTVPSKDWLPPVDQLTSLARAICLSLPPRSTVHVFADDICHAPFSTVTEKWSNDDQGRCLKLYPLPVGQSGSGLEKETRSEQPWMTWLTSSLEGHAVDILHCVCPGMLRPDHARLVIARDATPPQPLLTPLEPTEGTATGRALNYITPFEHGDSLTALGAWAAIFSAPATGKWVVESRQALRVFVDQFARVRPGVAAFHDLDSDPACNALAESYRFIIGDPSIPASTSPSVSVYCHPASATTATAAPASETNDLMRQFARVEEAIQSIAAASGPMPAWLASTQRIVEQAVARVADPKTLDGAAARGLASALEYVEQLVAQVPPATSQQSESAGNPRERQL
jgi:hypothetical protein